MWTLWRTPAKPFGGYNPPREESIVSLLGVPLDTSVSFAPGTRLAPTRIREAAESLEWFSFISETPVSEEKIYDEGDLVPKPNDVNETIALVSDFLSEMRKENRKTILLGGEHTLTMAVEKILGKKTLLIVFDAHADMRDEYLSSKINHATFLRRISENFPSENIVLVGTRALSVEEENYIKQEGIKTFSSRRIWSYGPSETGNKLERICEEYDEIYISIDMDVFDPAYAPGVGTPEPLGLDPFSFMSIYGRLLRTKKVIGIDVVETNPLLDNGYQTSFLAAKIIVEALGFL